MALTKVPSNLDSDTATTQSQGDGSTNVATTAYVDTGLANLIDNAPGNLNTLNELAAAMNDNASFFNTVLPLSGGTMTGDFAVGTSPPDFTVDRANSRVGINVAPDCGFQAKVDKARFQDPSAGQWLEINPDSNPVQIIASDQTGANYCAFKLKINNGGAYPITAMDVKGHSGAHVGFGTDAHSTAKMIISKNPDSATQTTPQTILQLSNPCVTTASDIKVGQGPQIVFEIPDDQAGNKSLGAAIAAQKQNADDNDSTTRLTFFTTGNDETLDEGMTILGDGKVGIGEDSPLGNLHVKSGESSGSVDGNADELVIEGAGNHGIQFLGPNDSNMQMLFGDSDDSDVGYLSYNHSTDTLGFGVNAAERLQLTSAGFLKFPSKVAFTGQGDAGIGHHTNNYMYVYGGSAGLVLQDNSGGSNRILLRDSNSIEFEVAGATTVNMDSNGYLGIGTAGSADTKLHVKDTGSIELRLEADSNNNGQEDCFVRFYTDGKTQEGIAGMDNNNSSTLFSGNTENAMVFGTVSNLPTLLATNNTERMIVTADGKVGIGTSSPGGTLDVHSSSVGISVEHDGNNHFNHVGEFFAPNTTANRNALFAVGKSGSSKNTGYLGYYWTASGSNNNFAHISHWASDYLFRVYGQGNYYFAGSSISDRDLKENIVDIPEPSLDKVKQLRVRKFNMIPLGDDDVTPTKVGFIAQEVQEAMPNVVTGTDGNKDMAVDTTGVVGHLVKAVQELSEKLDAAEARITELEG
tara:strand:- start:1820 stop:4063 length:2244 start_codon:yes stop_codon:yes gene_type:complete